jgi:hypothetical protein
MTKLTRAVVQRFPEHELTIERLFRVSDAFRSMCEDYADGLAALIEWERAAGTQLDAMIAELRESLAELEEEILRALEQATGRSG